MTPEPGSPERTRAARHLDARTAVIAIGVLVVWAIASVLATRAQRPDDVAPVRADRVVVVAVAGLDFASITPDAMPELDALARTASIGGISVRTGGAQPDLADAYATLGAGERVEVGDAVHVVVDDTGAATVRGIVADESGGDGESDDESGGDATWELGALADALAARGRTIGVLTPEVGLDRTPIDAPAVLAASDSTGHVDAVLGYDDAAGAARALDGLLARHDVVIVDAGGTGAAGAKTDASPDAAPAGSARVDALIGALRQTVDPATRLVVVGITPPTDTWALSPIVIAGAGIPAGGIESPTTHRRDLGSLIDVTPTVLATLGDPVPGALPGNALHHRADAPSFDRISSLNDLLVSRATTDRPLTLLFIVAQAVLYLAAVVMLVRGTTHRGGVSFVTWGVLTCATWPLITFLMRVVPEAYQLEMWTLPLTWMAAGLLAALALRWRRHPLDPLLAIAGATVAVIATDVSLGAHLQLGSFFGYAPNKGGRYIGIGNASFALLGAGTLAVCAALVSRSRRTGLAPAMPSRALTLAAGVAAAVVIADGAPWMGADVGGILTLVPVFGLTLWALSGRRIQWRTVLLAAAAAAAILAVAVFFDSLREVEDRTHLSRFFLGTGDTDSVRATLMGKWSANTRLLRSSLWAWSVPVTVAFSYGALALGRAWERVLPPRSPERIGVMSTLALALVGWLLNDSGIVVVAIASIYVGPFVVLLALGEPRPASATTFGDRGRGPDRSTTRPADANAAPTPMAPSEVPAGRAVRSGPARRSVGILQALLGERAAVLMGRKRLWAHPPSMGDSMSDADDRPRIDPAAPGTSRRDGQPNRSAPRVVALVPAKDRADSVAATVEALNGLAVVDRVVVIDDGSRDGTAEIAADAGADVLVLPRNLGKAGAVAAGVDHTPDADIYLLIDADVAGTAQLATALCEPVLADEADLAIGVLPSAGSKGGFGMIRRLAAAGVRRGSGLQVRAPLSGQRAVGAEWLRQMGPASRFGLEVAMTIDAARAGARVVEVEVDMDHRHTGRKLSGFAHRGRQGWDVVRALVPRVSTARVRIAAMLAITLVLTGVAMVSGTSQVPVTQPRQDTAGRVVVFGMQPLGFEDLDRGVTPNLARLIDQGAVGAMSTRTVARRSSATEGYLAIGAGARLRSATGADLALPWEEPVGKLTAGEYLSALTGATEQGELAVMGTPNIVRRNEGPEAASTPGALADVLHAAGYSAAVVANADRPESATGPAREDRAAALAAMRGTGVVEDGIVDPEVLVADDVDGPYGVFSDVDAVVASTQEALVDNEVVVVDPGDLDRSASFSPNALTDQRDVLWERALAHTDAVLGALVDAVGPDTMVLVTSVRAPEGQFRLTPFVAWGAGVPHGTITSPSTQRTGLSAITDVAPTVLDALGVEVPLELPGNPVRFEPGQDLDALKTLDDDTEVRERTYQGTTWGYIWIHAVIYGLALLVLARRPRLERFGPVLRLAMLGVASLPFATFAVRLVPWLTSWFVAAQGLVAVAIALGLAAFADRRRSHPLSPVAWVCGATTVLIVLDTWTGTHLQTSSWLGYSLHNAGRFYGVPNTTFAVLGACALIWAGIIVQRAARRNEAVWLVGCGAFLVLVSAGAPMLGADVGTLITLTPVFGVFLFVLSGHRIKLRTLVLAAAAMVLAVVLGAGVDLLRPAADRTHLGQFADRFIHEGPGVLWESFARKQSANIRIFRGSLWSRLIPIAGIFMAVPLLGERRADALLPKGSVLRLTCVTVVGAALLGLASNDSGPLVVALFVAYLPLLLAFVMFAEREPEPRWITAGQA